MDTNLVFFEVQYPNKNELMKKLEAEGIKGASPYARWRFVTHYGVDSKDIDYVLEVMANAVAS